MATRRAEDAVARRQAGMTITEDPTREGAGSLVGDGGGSRAGKAGLVSYSLEDYDGLTKDDSYVVIETQTSGSVLNPCPLVLHYVCFIEVLINAGGVYSI